MSGLDAGAKTFSSSWHRVAQTRLFLRPNVGSLRQEYRGESWYVLQDPFNNHFYRISKDAHAFLGLLGKERTVEEAWQHMVAHTPDVALSQEEVVQLLGQLNMSNLLQFDSPSVAASLFDRYQQRKARENKARWLGIFLSFRLPLWDPDRWLEAMLPLLRWIYGPVGLLLWLMLLSLALKVAVEQGDRLFNQAEEMLAPGNLLWLYSGFLIAKLVHELSHAAACKRFGGEVHVLGVMLVVFTPMPYVDATASWGFRYRWQRVLVGAAGMLAEFAVGAVAVLVWAWSPPGAVHAVAYNVMFVATVSTVLFNINPLLRFDGYYIFSDWLGVPNLYQRARQQLIYLIERYLFGLKQLSPLVHAPLEGGLMALYGLASLLYWVVVMTGILLFVTEQYLDVGLVLALVMIISSMVVPLFKLVGYLLTSPRLEYHRGRALAVTLGLCGLLVGFLAWVPLADRIRAPGVVEAAMFREVNSQGSGFLVALLHQPGGRVALGQALARLEAPDLETDIRTAHLQKIQVQAMLRRAQNEMVADLAPLQEQLQVLDDSLQDLERLRTLLVITAPLAGIWSAPEIEGSLGKWMGRGTSLGIIVQPEAFRFVAVLPQVDTHLFGATLGEAEVRLHGEEQANLMLQEVQVVPFQHGALPSPALGWAGGGEVAVDPADPRGLQAAEPFFLLRATFVPEARQKAQLVHGRSGTMRLEVGRRPLLWQWERAVRQFLQQKYRL